MNSVGHAQDSPVSALNNVRIPLENHEFIRRSRTAVGIDDCRALVRSDMSRLIATRRESGPDLHTDYGYTPRFIRR